MMIVENKQRLGKNKHPNKERFLDYTVDRSITTIEDPNI